jgi:hypothetical protein
MIQSMSAGTSLPQFMSNVEEAGRGLLSCAIFRLWLVDAGKREVWTCAPLSLSHSANNSFSSMHSASGGDAPQKDYQVLLSGSTSECVAVIALLQALLVAELVYSHHALCVSIR